MCTIDDVHYCVYVLHLHTHNVLHENPCQLYNCCLIVITPHYNYGMCYFMAILYNIITHITIGEFNTLTT